MHRHQIMIADQKTKTKRVAAAVLYLYTLYIYICIYTTSSILQIRPRRLPRPHPPQQLPHRRPLHRPRIPVRIRHRQVGRPINVLLAHTKVLEGPLDAQLLQQDIDSANRGGGSILPLLLLLFSLGMAMTMAMATRGGGGGGGGKKGARQLGQDGGVERGRIVGEGVGQHGRVGFGVGEAQGAAEGVAELVVQRHAYAAEAGAAEPGAVEGLRAGRSQ